MSCRAFFKMSGSGNDFVMFDARTEPPGQLADPAAIRSICARGTGVGADGIVFLEPSAKADFRMTYLNSDGSRAALCGNASLCVANLAVMLGAVEGPNFTFETDSGVIEARTRDSRPEIDLQPPTAVRSDVRIPLEAGEERIGFATVGVPHLVVLARDVDVLEVDRRGAALRRHAETGPEGANVNFVSGGVDGAPWRIRTFERGVEGETLACGTGAVAAAVLLGAWARSGSETTLRTQSGRDLTVRLRSVGDSVTPSLSGEGRLVFRGELAE